MKVTVIIPTCSIERIPLLTQTVDSIQKGRYKDIYVIVVADGNERLREIAHEKLRGVTVEYNKERIGWIASMNRIFKEYKSPYYVFASDDLEFPRDCIKNAMRVMEKRFPDGFGLVTLAKKNRCPFGLIGRKFVEHFPDCQVFCPDYKHYSSDTELQKFVKQRDIFGHPPERECRVFHHRPKDETWNLARQVRDRDWAIRDERKKKGYLWGIDFNRVTR